MISNSEAYVLRIYISNTDKFKLTPLYEVVVYAAKRYGLAGATVHKGIMGFGGSSSVKTVKFWEITEKLPLVVEIIDEEKNIDGFLKIILPWFERLRYGCMITVEKAHVVFYKKGRPLK